MSSQESEEVRLLRERISFLEKEILRLSEGKRQQAQDRAEVWEVIEEAAFSSQVPVTPSADIQLETGPPELPVICLNLAEKNLKAGRYSPQRRAEVAFSTGFWIRIALETHTPFQDNDKLVDSFPRGHWRTPGQIDSEV
eukprot:s203_g38.t1